MAILTWDNAGERLYETGVKKGVLYLKNSNGSYGGTESTVAAWNGLISVTESPSGAEPTALYADDIKYLNLLSTEEFGATVEAYTYPDIWASCDGSASIATGVTIGQQTRKAFGMAYRTTLGNDTESNDYGYKLHIIYDAYAQPTERSYSTINDSPEAITFSWELTTTPVSIDGYEASAHVEIDSTKISATGLAAIEEALYGTDSTVAYLPLPDELVTLASTT